MKEYRFEYTNQDFATVLIFGCIVLIVGTLELFSIYTKVWFIPALAISLVIPFLIFWLTRKKLKKQGVAFLNEDSIEFHLGDRRQILPFDTFLSYRILYSQDTILTINFKGDLRLKLFANKYFCRPQQFEILCTDLRRQIENYNLVHHANIRRIKSFYEKKASIYVLILLTMLLAVFLICAKAFSGFFPVFLPAMIVSIPMAWRNYFREQRKMKALRY